VLTLNEAESQRVHCSRSSLLASRLAPPGFAQGGSDECVRPFVIR
jgi:hypothetical protein